MSIHPQLSRVVYRLHFLALLAGSTLLAQAPNITATKTDATPAAAKKNPGDTVTYTNSISNTGTANATGVTFTDPDVNGAAVQAGTLKVSPVAIDDTYSGTIVSGVAIDTSVGTNFSVTTNDYTGIYNGAAGVLTITAFDTVTAHGGVVSMTTSGANVGKFTYTSAAGYTGADSFSYTVSNTGFTSTATVNLTVSGPGMFFVSNATGDDTTGKGTLAAPYKTLTKVATVDATGARIFVFAGTYSAGMTLENNEQIFGQGVVGANFDIVVTGVTAGVDSAARPSINGTIPTITAASGNVINLADGNVIRGVTINSTVAGFAVSGSGVNSMQFGSSGGASASDTAINSSSASSGGISLTTGGNGTVNILGLVSNSAGAGRSLTISGRTGGTVSVVGKVTDTGSGVLLNSNAGATFNLRCLALATGSNTALNVTSSGTINITSGNSDGIDNDGDGVVDEVDEANIINNTTGGIGLNIVSTNIGVNNVTFRSITSTGGTSPGINLSGTGSSGGLIVTGDGGGSNNASGGSITNKTGTTMATGTPGVIANNTANLTLRYMNITGCNHSGIYGNAVNGFILSRCNINTNGNDLVSNPDETGVDITNLAGSSSAGANPTVISNCVIQNNKEFELQITNSSGTLTDFQLVNCTIASNNADTLNPHGNLFNFVGSGTATMTANVAGCSFTGNAKTPGGTTATGAHCDISGTGSMTANLSACSFTDNNVAVNVSAAGAANLTFDVHDNPTVTVNRSHGLNCFLASDATGQCNGKFRNNVVGVLGTPGSGSDIGFGIRLQVEAASSANTANFLISGNTVQETANFNSFNLNTGLATIATTKTVNCTITSNIFKNSSARAITIQQNNNTNATAAGTLHVSVGSNTFSGIVGQAADGTEIRFRQLAANGGIFRVAQTDVNNLASANGLTLADLSLAGTFNYNQGAPTQPPLLFAPGGIEKAPAVAAPVPARALSPSISSDQIQPSPTPSGLVSAAPQSAEIEQLAQAQLTSLVAEARQRWSAAGLDAEQEAILDGLTFEVADLDGLRLGEAAGRTVRVDADGGTYGWYVGANDEAFVSSSSATRLYTTPAGVPAGRLDLLTALLHEMGHTLGLEDSYLTADRDSLMYGFLTQGERRLPAMNQARGVVPHEAGVPHFLSAPISIGTLPPGKSVTITYDVIINNPATTTTLSSQGTVSGGNFSNVLTDDLVSGGDPLLPGASDPTVTLIDLPDVAVGVIPASGLEDNGSVRTFTFTRQGATTSAMTVNFNLTGTADPATDYQMTANNGTLSYTTGASSGTITIASGSSVASFNVTPTADSVVEPDETIIVNVATGTSYDVGVPGSATSIITNDDTAVSIDTLPDGSLFEDQTLNFSYTFRRTGVTTGTTTVNFSVGGTAVFNTDYTQSGATTFTITTGTVVFAPGETTKTIILDPVNDNAVEGNETIILTVTSGTGYSPVSPTSQTATIVDDDVNVAVTSVAPSSVAEDSGTGMVYTFTRSGGSTANALTVKFTVGGTATYNVVPASSDYTVSGTASFAPPNGTFTFAGGQATKTVTITPVTDATGESDETVILTLAANGTPAVTGGYSPAASPNDSGTATIVNDDTTVSVAVSPSSVGESSGTSMVYTFTRTGSTAAALTANYTVTGTASFTAADFSGTVVGSSTYNGIVGTGTIVFPIGQSTATFTAGPLGDALVEANETVIVTVATGSGYVPAAGPNNVATGTINDDDVATVSIAKISDGSEGPPIVNGKFRVTQTAVSSTDTVINYLVTGTATPGAGNDYTALSGTVTILAGNTTADIDVLVLADAVSGEPNETVIVTFNTFGVHDADITFGSPTTATVNITAGAVVAAGSGDTAPGADGSTAIGKYNTVRRAFICQNGDYAYSGDLLIDAGPPAVTANDSQGLWAKDSTNPIRLIGRSGSIAPGTGNALYDGLPEAIDLSDDGDATFMASLRLGTGSPAVTSANDVGIWTTSSVTGANPQPALMAREGSALRAPSNAVITRFGSTGIATTGTNGGRAYSFNAIQSDGKSGLYIMTMNAGIPQAAVTTALEGSAAPGAGGELWASFVSSAQETTRMDFNGNYAWKGLLSPSGKTGVFYAPISTGVAQKVTIAGDAAPGTTTTFQSVDSVVMGGNNNISFHGVLAATGDNASGVRDEGIWRGVAPGAISTYTLILRRGDSGVAGMPGGSKVGRISGGWMTNANHGAWLGELDTNGDGSSIPAPGDVQAIYSNLSGTVTLAVKQGDTAPGMPGATFANLTVPAVGGVEQMAFIATTTGGGRTAGNNKGLWRSASNGGALTLALRTGGSITTAQGAKVVSDIAFSNDGAVRLSATQRVMDSTGRLMVRVTFVDGTSAAVLVGSGDDASSSTFTVVNPATATGTKGTAFNQTFTQTGGTAPVVFTTASRLPLGLTLATNGTLSGTPTQSGTFSIVVNAADAGGNTAAGPAYVLTISSATAPEIDIRGNSNSIASGDATPSTTDNTDFGSTPVIGGTVVRTFTIANTGNAALALTGTPKVAISGTHAADFTVTTLPTSPVAGAGSTSFGITFDPSVLGVRTATVTVENDDGDEFTYTFAIQGTGTLQAGPEIAFYKSAGSYRVDAGPNWLDNPLTVSGVEEAAALFGGTASEYSTSTNATTVSQTSWHSVWGVEGGSERADDYKLGTNYNTGIVGGSSSGFVRDNAIGAAFTNYAWRLTAAHAFPNTATGVTSGTQTFAIKNQGAGTLTITSATLTGGNASDFVLDTTGMLTSIPSGGTTLLTVAFRPTMFGSRATTLRIVNNDTDEGTLDVAFSGTGVGPEIDVLGNAVSIASGDTTPSTADFTDFGSTLTTGGTVVRTFTIANPGNAVLNLTGTPRVTVSGTNAADFTVTTLPSTAVATGGSTTFQVTFDPSAGSLRTATLSIASDDADENPYTFSIQGAGQAAVTSISPTVGPNAGGTTVTITGSGFTGTVGAGGVKFGTTNSTAYTVNSDTQITATSPAGSTGTVDITVTNPGGTSATSAADRFTYQAPATHFSVSAPASTTAGSPFSITVTALDATNATAPGYLGTVHFTKTDSGVGSALPSDYTFTAADNGVHTFTNGVTFVTAGTQTITATDTVNGGVAGTSGNVNVSAAAATRYVVSAPATATAGTAFNFTVTARDTFNNTATGYTGTAHFTSTDGAATLPANSTLTNGTGTFSATLKTAGNQTIAATDTVTASITGTSGTVSVGAAAASRYVVTAPASATAGTSFNLTVTAQDAFNNTAMAYAGTVHFTSTDGAAVLPANSTLTNGTGTFSATLKTAGNRTLTATDTVSSSITGTSGTVSVSAAAATHYTVSAPASATAGTAFNMTVTALDQFNNTATGYAGTVRFTSTDGAAVLPANSTLTSGTGTFSATLKTAGSQTLTATDTVSSSITGTSNTVSVSAAAATHYTVSAPASATAGTAFNMTVTALDQFNNTATGYAGTVHFTSTDGAAVLPANSTLTSGTGTFSATLKTAGSQTLTATDTVSSSIIGTSNTVSVSAATATHYAVSAPASATAGTAFNFTVTALDAFNNTATGYAGTVHFTSTDGAATLPANSTLTNGNGTFSATLKTAGSRTLTATDAASSSITGTSNTVSVSAAAATHYAVSAPATATAGTAFNFTVTALDAFNNTATSYAGTVHFTSSDATATLPGDGTLTGGVGTFSATLRTGGNQTLTGVDTAASSMTGTSGNVNVTPLADLAVTVTDNPDPIIAGNNLTYTITATNNGPSSAAGASVADTLPAGTTFVSLNAPDGWSATTPPVGSSGTIAATNASFATGSVVFTLVVKVAPSVAAGTVLSNTATASTTTSDPTGGNNSATATTTVATQADLAITKTDGVTTAVPGGSVTYTITATNNGPSDVNSATVADTLPAPLTATWMAVGAGGGTATASGSGNINDTVNIPVGGSVTYTVSATISAAATGTLSNTATISSGVTDPLPGNNSATDSDTLTPQANLAITKTDGVTTATPGGSVTYTITATNNGPSNAPGAIVADTLPASLTATWTGTGAGGGIPTMSGSGNINDTVSLPAGGSVTYTVSCAISPATTGTLSNTATVTAPGGVTDPTPDDNSATDSDTLTPQADLAITKTDDVTTVTPTGTVTYTITATNNGPSNAPGATVADTLPASLTNVTWMGAGAGGGTATAQGAGNINDAVNLPAGGSVTYTVTATVASTATGTLSNTATVAAPGGVTDPTPGNNSATDTDTVSTVVSITATDSSVDENTGDTGTWRITRNNTAGDLVVQLAIDASSTASETEWRQTGASFASLAAGSTGTLTIPNGVAFVDVTLTPVDDIAAEPAETVQLNINPDAAYTVINSSHDTVTIEVNDFVVTNTNDSGEGSLRQAVINANYFPGANVISFAGDTFTDNTPDVITLTTGELLVTDTLTIVGLGADRLTISGNHTSRAFRTNFPVTESFTLSGMTLTDGQSIAGGGAIYSGGSLTLRDIAIVGNATSPGGGGGIYMPQGRLTMVNCTVSGNSASGMNSDGGGIQMLSGDPSAFINCTVANNTAGGRGGGIYFDEFNPGQGGDMTITSCTITENSAASGGSGIGMNGIVHVTLANSIIAANANNTVNPDVGTYVFSGGGNLIGSAVTPTEITDGVKGDQVGTTAVPIDPLLGSLADNGGPMLTIKPLAGSPALNAGRNEALPADTFDLDGDNDTTEALPVDQRGDGFARVRGANVDVGAIEGNDPPMLALPVSPIVVEATKPQGADVTFTITASDAEDGDLTSAVVATPASGSTFGITGASTDTTVNVSVTDNDGATTTGSFVVTVQDTTAPVITPHDDIEVAATMTSGATVTFTAIATDAVGVTSLTYYPESGSNFPLGTTEVTVTATDAAGHEVMSTFNVIVRLSKAINTPIYFTGGPVIGAGSAGGPPLDAKWAGLGSPAIDQNGHLTFVSGWTSVTGGKGTGLFSDQTCLAIVGAPVPNVAGATFKSFDAPIIHDGRVASIVALGGVPKATASGILTVTVPEPQPNALPENGISLPPSDATLIVRAGDVATADGAKFKSFKSVDVRGSTTGFAASLTVGTGLPKTTAATDGGLWIKSAVSEPTLMLREGQTIDAKKIATITSFDSSAGSRGQGRGWLEIIDGAPATQARVVFTDRKQALLSASSTDGNVTVDTLIAAGDNLPGGFLVTNGFGFPMLNAAGQFASIVSTDSDTGPRPGIEVLLEGQDYERIAVRSGPTPLAGANFLSLQDPVLSEDGAFAFPAKVKGVGIKGVAANTLWWQPAGGSLTLLARGGAPTLSAVPNDLPAGAQWSAFSSLAIAADRGPIFVGTLVIGKGGVTKANASGVWAMDYQGKLRTLFRTNDTIVLDETHTKTLKSFNILTPTVGNTGVTRSHNSAHEITWLATFTDKTQAIIVTTIP